MIKSSKIKKDIPMNIAQKNRAIVNILNAITKYESFLLLGHTYPDEDCISSLVAFGLLIRKFNRKVAFYLKEPIHEQINFLGCIADYNCIDVNIGVFGKNNKPDAIFILDTPKTDMIEYNGVIEMFLNDDSIMKYELDHHFTADACLTAEFENSLILRASSTCEIIAHICYKLESRQDLLNKYQISEIYSRNIVLSMLTGMIGDAKLGNYLFKRRDDKFFQYFLKKLNNILNKKHQKKENISSVGEILRILDTLTADDHKILMEVLTYAVYQPDIGAIVINKENSKKLFKSGEHSRIVEVVKIATNALAENAGKVGLSVYYDPQDISDKIQFRIRASESANNLNLLAILLDLKIEDGGGHPGAVAFRIAKSEVKDIYKIVDKIIAEIRGVIENAQ